MNIVHAVALLGAILMIRHGGRVYNSIGVVLSKLSLKMCNCALIKTQDLCYYPVVGFPNWHVEGGFLIVPPNF